MTTDIISTELERIAGKHDGILRANDVVNEAKSVQSPLHDQFEWDDTIAGGQYRLEQARALIRVVVHVISKDGVEDRVWVSLSADRSDDGGGYRAVVNVLRNKSQRQMMLEDAMRDLESFRNKYARLTELSKVFSAIGDLKKK